MLRDQAQLQRTLDQAGVPQEGRSVTFQLADQGGGTQFRQPDDFPQPDTHRQSAANDAAPDEVPEHDAVLTAGPAVSTVWRRAGLDITA
jgi:hypothetical protein